MLYLFFLKYSFKKIKFLKLCVTKIFYLSDSQRFFFLRDNLWKITNIWEDLGFGTRNKDPISFPKMKL